MVIHCHLIATFTVVTEIYGDHGDISFHPDYDFSSCANSNGWDHTTQALKMTKAASHAQK